MLLRERFGTQFNSCFVPDRLLDFIPLYPQTCFRSTFILLTHSRFRILYLDRMPEFLLQGYFTWCWTTWNTIKVHSFPRFLFLSFGRQVSTNDHMVKDCSHVTFPVMLDMAPYAFLTKNWYLYQLAAGISHPAIPRTMKIITCGSSE
jgi:hypothetical protein